MRRLFKLTAYFIQQQWTWEQTSFHAVRNFQTERDFSNEFRLDYNVVEWDQYYFNYYRGVKKFLFKENTTDLSKAKQRHKIVAFMYYIGEPLILIMFCVVVCLPIYWLYGMFF